ncbi:hypothetical protein JM16_003581 [Phytophthora kernoviae]|uniref:Peptidase C1A papain C-terminal domain-containing protein n=1 Tax=Phytophthora kernoviae TaxID=325452 RepID=A0A8T0M3T3_9STRA|nr:hypothetical protein JM16_003581 [Phytophthora kernoviae]
MQTHLSAASVTLALAVMAASVPNTSLVVQARPMHADIVHIYHRYLEEKENVSSELDKWLTKYGPKGPKNGWIPVTESRSTEDELEDQRQRFYLTMQQIYEAREANPGATFGVDGPFTLMTMEEFKQYLANYHTKEEEQSNTPEPTTKKTKKPATDAPTTLSEGSNDEGSPTTDSKDDKNDNNNDEKVYAPATEGPQVVPAIRRRLAAQCIAGGGKSAPVYSKQQLVSCDTKDFGCNGGAPVYAMQYIQDNGICTESSYPYASQEEGTAPSCAASCTPTKPGIKSIEKITPGDESALIAALQKQPIIASVSSDNTMWKQYMSGVITSCNTVTVDHAVLVVGYDDTSLKIKNSWGTDWGEDGYVRVSRSKQNMGTCAVLTDMSYPQL